MKFRIISGIMLAMALLLIWATFADEKPQEAVPVQAQDQGSGYSGMGK